MVISENASQPMGTVMKIIETRVTGGEPYYITSPSSTARDKGVIGINACSTTTADGFLLDDDIAHLDVRYVNSVGNGQILVCSENGNIEVGDWLCTSNVAGHAMKQDEDQLLNITVAKSTAVVDWSTEPNDTKLITCTIHCG